MTQIAHNQVTDFLQSLRENSSVCIEKYGYVIRLEERLDGGSHIGKSLKVHPGNDSLDCCLLDCQAIAKDNGRKLTKSLAAH